ncbi:DUF2868 domain-containing protein [Roseibacillus persicicus]|uniref:DUF2868 domain-containing protein n=1 Tax=Roseibacillus persicicus TaxID=454148 RepID=A0A918TYB8_9BACT|nr:DUF2868 domain-containing protein [Roseibacillus persicicus]GHC65761.1 hypothetical protein GCM10007100_36880 [Roseibacillus persicicus]
MARAVKEDKWTLADLADFESVLTSDDASRGARRIYRETVSPQLSSDLDEATRRRQGLRLWLEAKRGDDNLAGQKLESGLRLAGLVVKVLALLAGLGIARGLLQELPMGGGRGYNIWLFLGVTLGLQWLFLLGGGVAWLLFRKSGRLTWSQELLSFLGRKFAGSRLGPTWSRLIQMRSEGYGSVLGWRLASISQLGAVWLGFGIVASFIGCLWFLKVNFYWESTLQSFSETQLVRVTDGLSLPWSWAGEQWRPGSYGVEQASLEVLRDPLRAPDPGPEEEVNRVWMRFLVLAILVWGILPRLVLYFYCVAREKRALASLDFQESRHRNLWREMAKVERTVVKTSQADGVVLLDVGGSGLSVESVRPFLLQQLRVNPESVHQTGVLDASKEEAAVEAMKQAALGVVMAVEGWSLSGPQMKRNYEMVRGVIGEKKPIRFLVVGTVKGDQVTEVDETEMAEWVKFVDGLRDPAVEVVKWES